MVKYAVNVRTREDASGPVEAPAVSDVKKRIRAVCQGNAICPAGTLDCCSLAWELRIRYRDCPVKIGVFGCSGPCLRAAGHRGCYDYEICGGCMVQPETQYCIHCGKCEKHCPVRAIRMTDGVPLPDGERCVRCGVCARSCPVNAWNTRPGFLLSARGERPVFVHTKDELFALLDRKIQRGNELVNTEET